MGFKGKIGTEQKCPKCGGKFEFKNNDLGLICEDCLTRPDRLYITAKGLGFPKKLYSNSMHQILDSWGVAVNFWTDINNAYNKSLLPKGKAFNPKDFIAAEVKLQEFQNKASQFLQGYDAKYTRGKLSTTRYRAVKNIVNKFLTPYFKGKDIRFIDKEDVGAFYYYLLDLRFGEDNAEKYSDIHIRDIMAVLKSMFLEYRASNEIPEFPDHSVLPKKEKQWLGIERQMAIEPKIPGKYKLPLRLLQFTGMRLGELRALQVKDMIDGAVRVWKAFDDKGLKLARKSGGEVVYQVSLDLWEDLRAHTEGLQPDSFIFTLDGHPLGCNCLPRAWRKACVEAGVKYIPLQQASRHSTASRIMADAKKKALEDIQKQLGHDNRTTGKKHYVVE